MRKSYTAIINNGSRLFAFRFQSWHRFNVAAVRKDCKAALLDRYGIKAVNYRIYSL